jgi:uncharacterized BrkB/YihY/UPF0761 family membrane protein
MMMMMMMMMIIVIIQNLISHYLKVVNQIFKVTPRRHVYSFSIRISVGAELVGMLMVCLSSKYCTSSHNGQFVIAVKLKAKYQRYFAAAA